MKYLRPIQETTYLNTANSANYRRIMRIFFQEYEKVHFQLYKEDVYDIIKNYPEFQDYTMEQLKLDLNALVEWKNLVTVQDPRRVYTIADYKNKQFRYSMSEYSVEIERMTVRLENLFIGSGSLSPNLFLRIYNGVEQFTEMESCPLKQVNEWWHNLQEDFRRLNQNYQDYLREFYSGNADKLLKSVEFILHKDRLITYLKDFVKELQVNSAMIEAAVKKVPEETQRVVLERVVQSELEIPRTKTESQETLRDNIIENVNAKWEVLKNWFVTEGGSVSESVRVMEITDEIIRKIVQNAAMIVQLQNWGISRKNDYKKFIEMFLKCGNMEGAHKLSAHLFGVQSVRHYKVNSERSTDSIFSSTYEEEPSDFLLRPRTRKYKPRIDKSGFENKSMEKLLQRNAYLEQVESDKRMVLKYIKENKLDIGAIDEVVAESTRTALLRWISAAGMTASKTGRTEYGRKFRLVRKEEDCVLRCEDGNLVMPAYVLEFEEDGNE